MANRQLETSKETIWRDHLAKHASSGKSIAVFCRTAAISQANFYAWRTKLRAGTHDLLTPPAQPTFIDLGAVPSIVTKALESRAAIRPTAPVMQPTRSTDLRIGLGGGIVLTIMRR